MMENMFQIHKWNCIHSAIYGFATAVAVCVCVRPMARYNKIPLNALMLLHWIIILSFISIRSSLFVSLALAFSLSLSPSLSLSLPLYLLPIHWMFFWLRMLHFDSMWRDPCKTSEKRNYFDSSERTYEWCDRIMQTLYNAFGLYTRLIWAESVCVFAEPLFGSKYVSRIDAYAHHKWNCIQCIQMVERPQPSLDIGKRSARLRARVNSKMVEYTGWKNQFSTNASTARVRME